MIERKHLKNILKKNKFKEKVIILFYQKFKKKDFL